MKNDGAILVLCTLLLLITCLSVYQIGFNAGYNAGYEFGYEDGYSSGHIYGNHTGFEVDYIQGVADGAGRGYTMRDTTYSEALRFMWTDQTDKHRYMENYTCLNFAADFKENALEAGYKCGFVYLKFPEGAHALVCFSTTDKGLVFIEPQFDTIMKVEVGIRCWVDNWFQSLDIMT